ncbi:MAG: DNA polymerase I, partial [Elusimicrobia bacterium]|nr:DNA polymerase I [Elusimicrobiota bacterium]
MKPRLYLIDAHAYLHRAYHALPPLNNSRGEPVGALYGFARTLLQLLRREKPELVAVCFDHPEPTFRHKAFAPYKATRKELDADLVGQLKSAAPLARAMGLACVEQPGYEADDLMATLARRAVEEGLEAVLVTADKDALQLVGPGVRVLRDVTNSVWMESEQVEAKLGVPPSLVVDYLSLVGDASDNVPGVKGVGPVGASKLLKRFGGLDGVLAAARRADPEVPAKTAKALLAAEGDIPLYRRLIALRADVPLSLKPSQCAPAKPEEATLRPLFEGLEFGSLLKELLPASFSAAPLHSESAKTAPDWKDVEPEEWLRGLDRSTPLLLSCLRSAPSLVDASPVHLALALEDGRSAVFDRAACGRWRSQLSALLTGGALKSV